jgi:thiol-disulfide isomerase/thioredoxin
MKYILVFAAFLITVTSFSQDRSIKFETDKSFQELLKKAKSEKKLIFIDAYTTWCGPCKWMAKNMFTKNEIADYYNLNFINAKFDMEKGEGIELAKKYEVFCYPNLLFIDGDGKLIHRSAGAAQEIADYINLGETAKDPKKSFSALMDSYDKKHKDPEFLSSFINAISTTCLPYEKYVNDYFSMQKEEDLISELNWEMIDQHLNSYDNREFKYLLANISKFEELYSKEAVHAKIENILMTSAQNLIYSKDFSKEKMKAFMDEVNAMSFEFKEKVMFSIKMMDLEKAGDMDALFEFALKDGEKYMEGDQINGISWSIYENSDNKTHLTTAAQWMEKLTNTETGRTWQNMDTHAALLLKLKEKQKAKEVATAAIELAKVTGISAEDYKATEELLKEINKLK